jgi:hypothetical protein
MLEQKQRTQSDFGFWILDFGLGESTVLELTGAPLLQSKIQNPKSKIQNRYASSILS